MHRDPSSETEVPPLEGRHVYLRPITPSDYRFLQEAELGPELAMRWRHRGATPSPEEWARGLWIGVLAQHLIVARDGDAPLGLALVHNPSFQDGYAYFAAVRLRPGDRSPAMMLGVGLFLQYVFANWNFRKLYLEVAEFNLASFASGLGLFQVEARLKEHLWFAGRYWDQLTLALYRNTWELDAKRLLGAELAVPSERGPNLKVRVTGSRR